MVVPYDKILINLAYKAPELKLQYALAELLDYVQEVKLLEDRNRKFIARIAELEDSEAAMKQFKLFVAVQDGEMWRWQVSWPYIPGKCGMVSQDSFPTRQAAESAAHVISGFERPSAVMVGALQNVPADARLPAVWYRQGFDAFLQGKARGTLWNNDQKQGWDHAHNEAEAAIDQKEEKPGLDATPWQTPLDVGLTLGGAA